MQIYTPLCLLVGPSIRRRVADYEEDATYGDCLCYSMLYETQCSRSINRAKLFIDTDLNLLFGFKIPLFISNFPMVTGRWRLLIGHCSWAWTGDEAKSELVTSAGIC